MSLLIPPGAGRATKEVVDQIRATYGLDKPLHIQFFLYLNQLVRLDLGSSIQTGRPVIDALKARYPATLELGAFSLLLAIVVSIPLGVLSAVYRNSLPDHLLRVLALAGMALPNFWLGLMFILLFSLRLGWLPASGYGGPFWTWEGFKHIILPGITLSAPSWGLLVRLTRSSMLEVLGEDYLATARAKGLRESAVIFRHALRNALIPVVTVFGLQFGVIIAGATITETVFAWPGIGRYLYQGIVGNDFPVVRATVLVISIGVILINLLVDLVYVAIDPRITYD
jgi:ABC-type dipeptide/oligopeptide/nickel transport system permease component